MYKFSGNSITQMLVTLAHCIIRMIGSAIFFALTVFSLIYTQYMIPGGSETPRNTNDSIGTNLLILLLFMTITYILFNAEKKIPQHVIKIISYVSVTISMIIAAGIGLLWITAVDRIPDGDQAYLYGGASYFLEGNFVFLQKDAYMGMCPHQLGLVFLMELLFLVVGTYNYFAFQVICVLSTVGIVFLGWSLIRKMCHTHMPAIIYSLLISCCLPLFFYSGWVYGDIPSIFWILLAANFLVSYDKKRRGIYLVGIVISFIFAILVRQNSLIFLIAFCLAVVVKLFQTMDKKLLIGLLFTLLCPILATSGINKLYEFRSGIPHANGMPAYSYITMGLQEQSGICGWHSLYCKDVYYEANYDSDIAAKISKQDMKERLSYMMQNPTYTVTFFGKKLLSQWNAPLYQCLFFSHIYTEGNEPAPDSLVWKINTDYYENVLNFCDYLQLIVYWGTLYYFWLEVKKNHNTLHHFMAIGILGGFFFSIIWEAKARYILPYYVVMFPLAVIGYKRVSEHIHILLIAFVNKYKLAPKS